MAISSPRESGDDPDVMVDINTTPLIDVMLVLLVMLIITIPIQTHSVKLNLPNGTPPPALTKPVVVTLDVAADGNLFWNGVRIENDTTLEQKFKGVVDAGNEAEIHLRPNKAASYDRVALVLSAAQRLGIKKLGLIGHEQFGE
jgi:biopolymer transport protein ExbD